MRSFLCFLMMNQSQTALFLSKIGLVKRFRICYNEVAFLETVNGGVYEKLTEGNIWKNFILFAIPLILSGLLSTAYTMIDTMIAGYYLGEAGLAATGATSSMLTFVSSLFWGYMVGFGMYIARLFGEGAYERIRRGTWVRGSDF